MNTDLIERNETNQHSKGGTELLQDRLYDGSVPRELLEQFQIVFSKVRDLDENRYRIFYAHDLPGDPESEFLHNEGWRKFHKLVFVSNWQMQQYIARYNIPWSHCEVIENSIIPITPDRYQPDDQINLFYTSTPHRGLHLVYAAFRELAKKHENIYLNVFSSFNLYGWGQRDEQYKNLFNDLDEDERVRNYRTQPNYEVRGFLAENADIFVHPGTWPETSCLCLIEAMSAGVMCVHSNHAALADTAGGMTYMYQFEEDENKHATKLYHILDGAIQNLNTDIVRARRHFAKIYADTRFNWTNRAHEWAALLSSIAAKNPDKGLPKQQYVYRA